MSDPARPESSGRSALLELEAVIRHVTEQLAGYRRRALSAEAQVRDLEMVTSRAAEMARAAESASRRIAALEKALADAEAATAAAVEKASKAAAVPVVVAPARSASGGGKRGDDALVAENEALRGKLEGAAERTRQISERVRFLRQQISNGGDK